MLFFEKYIIIDPLLDPQGVSLFVKNEFSNPVNGRFRVFFACGLYIKLHIILLNMVLSRLPLVHDDNPNNLK